MKYLTDQKMKDYTTLRIGGPAARLYEPETILEIRDILAQAKEEGQEVFVLGNGSNVLFEDEGYDGWVIHIGEAFTKAQRLDNNRVRIQAGMTNEDLAFWLASQGLGGYAFASGIPGTLGGAVVMNAGAYGGELKEVLESVTWMDEEGTIWTTPVDELDLGYRHSRFTDTFGVVLEAVLQFYPNETETILAEMAELKEKRWSKQPMEDASAGSTFKRPAQGYASKLIHDSNLQGLSVGDAQVSLKHAGFLVNKGNASCQDFLNLVEAVRQQVLADSGIELEMEIHYVSKNRS